MHEPEHLESIHSFEDELDENFLIHSEIDILFILRGIMQSRSLITLYLGQEHCFILTSILNIDTDNKKIIIDHGSNEEMNQLALQTKELVFVTTQNKIKIKFKCNELSETTFEGQKAFSVNIPQSLLRIQRRDSFRISTPIIKPIKCVIPISIEDELKKTELPLINISCSGIGMIDQKTVLHPEPGITFNNCQITLPQIGVVNATIKIKNAFPVKLQNGQDCQRIGCKFIDLPAKTEAMIQRYIVKQEQKSKK